MCTPILKCLMEQGPQNWWRDLPTFLHTQARVKVSSSRDGGIAMVQQMREPSAFLCASVCPCLGSLIPESAPLRALVEGKPSHRGGDEGQERPWVLWVLREMKLF